MSNTHLQIYIKTLLSHQLDTAKDQNSAQTDCASVWFRDGPAGFRTRTVRLRLVHLVVSSGGTRGQRRTRSPLDVNKSHPLPPLPLLCHLQEHRRSTTVHSQKPSAQNLRKHLRSGSNGRTRRDQSVAEGALFSNTF